MEELQNLLNRWLDALAVQSASLLKVLAETMNNGSLDDFSRWGLTITLLLGLGLLFVYLLFYAVGKSPWLLKRPALSLFILLALAFLTFWAISPRRPCLFAAEHGVSACRLAP